MPTSAATHAPKNETFPGSKSGNNFKKAFQLICRTDKTMKMLCLKTCVLSLSIYGSIYTYEQGIYIS